MKALFISTNNVVESPLQSLQHRSVSTPFQGGIR